jgi:peptidoglycan glycosyltransferase
VTLKTLRISNWCKNRRLEQGGKLRADSRGFPRHTLIGGCALLFLVFAVWVGTRTSGHLSKPGHSPSVSKKSIDPKPEKLSSDEVSAVLRRVDLSGGQARDTFVLKQGPVRLAVETSIDTDLQEYILDLLRHSRAIQAAVVALRPSDGRILAMASYGGKNGENLCLKADFPAASLFKIVSAAAAMELAGFTPDHAVFYRGRRHTLYKNQLKQGKGHFTSRTSFRRAFAASINAVFGKVGIYQLGKQGISEYADKFFFNEHIPFELPVEMSIVRIPEDDFGLAEVASGFNKNTRISPLHAALMGSAVANKGVMMTPWVVERVSTLSGEILYQGRPSVLGFPISRGTAEGLKIMMHDSIQYGTCRKSLMKLLRKRSFRDVEMGAKTGTINDRTDQYKYDWLTVYALPPKGEKAAICVAILCVHGEKLGVRANELGRLIIRHHLRS